MVVPHSEYVMQVSDTSKISQNDVGKHVSLQMVQLDGPEQNQNSRASLLKLLWMAYNAQGSSYDAAAVQHPKDFPWTPGMCPYAEMPLSVVHTGDILGLQRIPNKGHALGDRRIYFWKYTYFKNVDLSARQHACLLCPPPPTVGQKCSSDGAMEG